MTVISTQCQILRYKNHIIWELFVLTWTPNYKDTQEFGYDIFLKFKCMWYVNAYFLIYDKIKNFKFYIILILYYFLVFTINKI